MTPQDRTPAVLAARSGEASVGPPDRARGILGAAGFAVVAVSNLIASAVGGESGVTRATEWMLAGFAVLVIAGVFIEYRREQSRGNDGGPVLSGDPDSCGQDQAGDAGPGRPPRRWLQRRTVLSFLLGAVTAGALCASFFLAFGPAGPPATAPGAGGRAGRAVTVSTAPDATADVIVTVDVRQELPAGYTYWLMVQFTGGANTVYKAEGKVARTPGDSTVTLDLSNSAVGSVRTIYVLRADSQATPSLQQNFDNPQPGWDGNRTSLPPAGVDIVSKTVTVTRVAS
jgi:hypothetical protein